MVTDSFDLLIILITLPGKKYAITLPGILYNVSDGVPAVRDSNVFSVRTVNADKYIAYYVFGLFKPRIIGGSILWVQGSQHGLVPPQPNRHTSLLGLYSLKVLSTLVRATALCA